MKKRLIGTLLAAALTAGGLAATAQPASAASASSGGTSCSFALSKGSGYVGSVMQGWAKVTTSTCLNVQSEISYLINGNGQCSLKSDKGPKIKGTSKVYAANNNVTSRAAYVWVKSGASSLKVTF